MTSYNFLHAHHPPLMAHDLALMADTLMPTILYEANFNGWNDSIIRDAASAHHYDYALIQQIFYTVPDDIMRMASGYLTSCALHNAQDIIHNEARIHKKIYHALMALYRESMPYKNALQSMYAYCLLPQHIALGAAIKWRMADRMWHIAGDDAVDHNHYTKRMTLIGMMTMCFPVWLQDDSDDLEQTDTFLRHRLANIGQFHQAKSTLQNTLPITMIKNIFKGASLRERLL